jgi:hypothetical protein
MRTTKTREEWEKPIDAILLVAGSLAAAPALLLIPIAWAA